jgi:membrane-associated phospholipid phosphatase
MRLADRAGLERDTVCAVLPRYRSYFWATLLAFPPLTASAGGPFGIDHELARDDDGIWSRNYQLTLEYGVIATEIGGALWLGNDDKLGHTMWQTLDSSLISGLIADVLKDTIGRARPDQGNNPNTFFKGSGYQSFPSGEVTLQASFVTPIIVNYAKENPWIWGLEVLPAYDAIGRLKSQAHWQSDVIAGWMIGTGIGYWASTWKVPLTVRVLPRGLSVGLSKRF